MDENNAPNSVVARPLKQTSLALKHTLKRGQTAFATFTVFKGSRIAQVHAHSSLDAVIIDCEHGNIDDSDMHDMVSVVASNGVSPIVRIPSFTGPHIKRALDTGAQCVMRYSGTNGHNAEDARTIGKLSKFPPAGIRGQGSPFACFSHGFGTPAEYVAKANDCVLLMAQIETVEGVKNIDRICQVDGLDLVLIGPNDLSLAILGYAPPKGDESHYYSAIDTVVATAKERGKYVGMVVVDGESAKSARSRFDLVVLTADVRALQAWYKTELKISRS